MNYVGSKIEGKDVDTIIKDDDGYFKMFLGEVNKINAMGMMYLVKDIDHLLTSGETIISSRIKEGIVEGEVGHPDFDGLTGNDLVNKILNIDKDNVCCHIRGIFYENTGICEDGFEGYPIYKIYGWVKPIVPKGEYLEDALINKFRNVPFSIRSIAIPYIMAGIEVREIIDIGTWDWVHEPGYKNATQWYAAGVESTTYNLNLCVDGHCKLKIEEGLKIGAFANNDAVKKIYDSLTKRLNDYNPIYDL